jgi:hypothetical protein
LKNNFSKLFLRKIPFFPTFGGGGGIFRAIFPEIYPGKNVRKIGPMTAKKKFWWENQVAPKYLLAAAPTASGANPATFEFAATTPALRSGLERFFQIRIKIFSFQNALGCPWRCKSKN